MFLLISCSLIAFQYFLCFFAQSRPNREQKHITGKLASFILASLAFSTLVLSRPLVARGHMVQIRHTGRQKNVTRFHWEM